MVTEPEYDERTCVTAGQLRAQGWPLPSHIPGCAWIPRGSMRLAAVLPEALDGDTLHATMEVEFLVPFRWVDATVTMGAE